MRGAWGGDALAARPRSGALVDRLPRVVGHEHGGEGGTEAAAAGVQFLWSGHSMISSPRANSEGGIVRPRAFAVLRFMTSWYLEACSTGRSAGLAPLRILSM